MTDIPITNAAGTQKSRQQTRITQQAWIDTDGVHFPDGSLTTLPSYAAVTLNGDVELDGVTRHLFAQKFDGSIVGTGFLFGTHTRLYGYKNGVLANITPFAGETNVSFANNPVSFTSGSATATLAYTAHGLTTSDYVTISGYIEHSGSGVTDAMLNKRFKVASVPTANTFTVTMGANASATHANVGGSAMSMRVSRPTIALGTNKMSVINGDSTLTVNHTAHGLRIGDRISIMGASTFGGVTADTYINIEHIVDTVADDDHFTVELDVTASSTASGGTGAAICTPIAEGIESQGAAAGFGVGIYGNGIFNAERYSDTSQSYPRIWSCGRFGIYTVCCPSDYTAGDGQKIYMWNGDTDSAAFVMLDAPTDCNWVDVINNQVVALCGQAVKIGQTDPVFGSVTWSGYGYFETNIQNVWKNVSTARYGDKSALIFSPARTPTLLSYVGDAGGIWDAGDVIGGEAIIAPMAHCSMGGMVYYMGSSGQLNVFNGSSITRVVNEQNGDYVARDINKAQAWKIHMMADPYYNQVWVFYPSAGSDECDAYMIAHADGHFTLGRMTRSATQKPDVIDSTFYMVGDTTIYRHYTGENSTNPWFAQSAMILASKDRQRVTLTKVIMDGNQEGSATFTAYGADYPREEPSNYGSETIDETTEYVSIPAAGVYLGYKLSGEGDFTLGDISFEVGV